MTLLIKNEDHDRPADLERLEEQDSLKKSRKMFFPAPH